MQTIPGFSRFPTSSAPIANREPVEHIAVHILAFRHRQTCFRFVAALAAVSIAMLLAGSATCVAVAEEPAAAEPVPAADKSAENLRLKLPGYQGSGRVLLPTQWSLKPSGVQVKLGDFPVQLVLHPSGTWACCVQAGNGENGVTIVDLVKRKVTTTVPLEQCFYGACFSPDGSRLFVSGGEFEVVHSFAFDKGNLSDRREIIIADPKSTFIPSGMACDAAGTKLYVACTWGHSLAVVELNELSSQAEKKSGPATVTHVKMPAESYPYTVLPAKDGKRLFVSLWNGGRVAVLDNDLKIESEWATESHPTEMVESPDGKRLFVSCANSNQVDVIDTITGSRQEAINTALYPNSPSGSTPNSIACTDDGKVLFVANADNNNLAVFDTSTAGKSVSLGYIPVGWYPTSVRYSAVDKRIYVTNGKGVIPKANVHGPNPLTSPPRNVTEYIGGLFSGTLSCIDSPDPAQMAKYTRDALSCSPLQANAAVVNPTREPGHPIPTEIGQPSPIKYCIYVVKENRTYDQVLGDMPEGNGARELCLFPEKVTPNQHAIAREFVLLDNFYVESEVSADGHEWTMAAYATDYVEKVWPLNYRPNQGKLKYPSEGAAGPIAAPAGGYIWDRCKEAGVSYRSYGEFVKNGATPADPATATVEALVGHIDPMYRGYDLEYPDVKRVERFLSEVNRFEKEGGMPQFNVVRLGNDHTSGTRAGRPTPTAMVAENDLAVGLLIEGLSKSSFWKETAVFIVEDDAQNGSDHVDAHRTIAFVVSPYCRRKAVDSNMYSTSSMLRTMELILGLQPMSQFDAAALPMYASFQAQPDLSPFTHRPAGVDLDARNSPRDVGSAESERMDFSAEDRCDDLQLNEIIWKSIRGADSKMPPPVRASFVFASGRDDDDDEEHEEDHDDDRDDEEETNEKKDRDHGPQAPAKPVNN